MPLTFGAMLAQQVGQQAAQGAMGLGLGALNDARQLKQQGKLLTQQQKFDREQMQYQNELQYDMWQKTNYSAQKDQMKKAGLNPALMYGMGGGGGVTTGQANASVNAEGAPRGGNEIMGMMQIGAQQAQIELMKAQAQNLQADTQEKLGWRKENVEAGTGNVKADTENKILNSILLKYTGQEAKDQYEQIKAPNRGIEGQTYQYNLTAQQAVAETMIELWENGRLYDKSNGEIEQILLNNAKTREETRSIIKGMDLLDEKIKGEKIENIIKDLEMRLQTETGIDRSAPTWLKILGRLFTQLMGGSIKNMVTGN